MRLNVVGIGQEFAHHYRIGGDSWRMEVVEPDQIADLAEIDVAVLANEFFTRNRAAVERLRALGIPTIYAIDGILEWRNAWDFPLCDSCQQTFRPVLSDKVACIGRSQARILESWGNVGKCEVVGVPRFDPLLGKTTARAKGETCRVLVMTAKNPGFDELQRERTRQSLKDLKQWFEGHRTLDGRKIEPLWRLTAGMDRQIGVQGETADTTGKELAEVLATVDAVITTPSTGMLEAMLLGLPTALLDYHNCPHYVPGAWTIGATDHIAAVLPELASPPPAKLLWQDTILHDALECRTEATPRFIQLVESLAQAGREARAAGLPLNLPDRIVPDPQNGHHAVEPRFDLATLYPSLDAFRDRDRQSLQVKIAHLEVMMEVRDHQIQHLQSQLQGGQNGRANPAKPPASIPFTPKDRSLRGRLKRLGTKIRRKVSI